MAGSISSAGIGSGLDVNSIITQLVALEQAPLKKLQTQAQTIQTQLSAFGQLQSLVSAFKDATTPLLKADNYALTTATSADATSVAASSTTAAAAGQYAVNVTALAAGQIAVTASDPTLTSGASVVGTGTLKIQLGTFAGTGSGSGFVPSGFTAKSGSAEVSITIDSSNDTLAGIRDAINNANAGITASIVNDGTGARLALQSKATGAENGFRIQVLDSDFDATTNPGGNTDAAGLSRLALDVGATRTGFTQTAANATGTINGIAVTSTTNTFATAVEGLSFTFNKVSASPVNVTVARNTDAPKTMVTSFVAAFNALNTFLANSTKYDPATRQGALFQGDSTVVGLQSQLRALVGQATGASGTFSTLSAIGVEFQKDGSLKVNDSKLATALANPTELKKALSNVDSANAQNTGLVQRLSDWSSRLLTAGGAIPSRTEAFKERIKANLKDQDRAADRIAATEARLRKQYTALDATMSNANALGKYVQQQITTWNKSTG